MTELIDRSKAIRAYVAQDFETADHLCATNFIGNRDDEIARAALEAAFMPLPHPPAIAADVGVE